MLTRLTTKILRIPLLDILELSSMHVTGGEEVLASPSHFRNPYDKSYNARLPESLPVDKKQRRASYIAQGSL